MTCLLRPGAILQTLVTIISKCTPFVGMRGLSVGSPLAGMLTPLVDGNCTSGQDLLTCGFTAFNDCVAAGRNTIEPLTFYHHGEMDCLASSCNTQ